MKASRPKDDDGSALKLQELDFTPLTPDQCHAATQVIRQHAADATVAQELLEMLGLDA